jgi:hypothetical protein
MSSFGSLFLYSFLAVLEIILLCAAGSLMARLVRAQLVAAPVKVCSRDLGLPPEPGSS